MSRTYSPGERHNIVHALQFAHERIWDGNSDYFAAPWAGICAALPEGPDGDMARAIVMERLEGYFGVRTWLIKKGHLRANDVHTSHRAVQDYRKAWLKELIKEFSE